MTTGISTQLKENQAFHKFWEKDGYKFKPETDEEADWLIVVRYWAWKSWEARAKD